MPNPVMRWQIISPQPEASSQFYCSLFGWQAEPHAPQAFHAIGTGSEQGIQGSIWPAPPAAPSFVQLFIEVEDCAMYVTQAVELGGSILFPPQTLPGGEVVAIVKDPTGMSFGIMQAGS
ncbi:VOC family protein [Chitinimonas naiadis]